MVMEVLAIKIRQEKYIKSINSIKKLETKIILYADDITLLLNNDKSLQKSLEITEAFGIITGLKLNMEKCTGMNISKNAVLPRNQCNIKWIDTKDHIKILGFYFNNSQEISSIDLNWKPKINKIKTIIERWRHRDLSLYGKIILSKTFLLSQILFQLQALFLPEEVITEIDRILFKFIWQKKFSNRKAFEKIKRSTLCKDVSEGGLNMISVKLQQKTFLTKWMKKLMNPKNEIAELGDIIFKNLGGTKYILKSTSLNKDAVKVLEKHSQFWSQAIKAQNESKRLIIQKTKFTEAQSILAQPLFNNLNIRYKNNTLFFREYINNNIRNINDICQGNRIKSFSEMEELFRNKQPNHIFLYNALINAIPEKWKEIIHTLTHADFVQHTEGNEEMEFNNEIINRKNSEIRLMLNDTQSDQILWIEKFWDRKYQINIKDYFLIAINCTKESRLRLLHFKIIHNIYPTNILLSKMKIKDTDKCITCKEMDFIEHFFIECKLLKSFWRKIELKIRYTFDVSIKLTHKHILFGITKTDIKDNTTRTNKINLLLLIAKLSISKFKYGTKNNIDLIFENEYRLRYC